MGLLKPEAAVDPHQRDRTASRAVQSGARRDGIAGVYGNAGIVESVTYRIYRRLESPNPTLSANICPLLSFTYKDESSAAVQRVPSSSS
jgi:hypothetical protein